MGRNDIIYYKRGYNKWFEWSVAPLWLRIVFFFTLGMLILTSVWVGSGESGPYEEKDIWIMAIGTCWWGSFWAVPAFRMARQIKRADLEQARREDEWEAEEAKRKYKRPKSWEDLIEVDDLISQRPVSGTPKMKVVNVLLPYRCSEPTNPMQLGGGWGLSDEHIDLIKSYMQDRKSLPSELMLNQLKRDESHPDDNLRYWDKWEQRYKYKTSHQTLYGRDWW